MADRLISEKVLLSLVDNWKNISDYYHPNSKNDKIPISEVKAIIKSTPTAGDDAIYLHDKRLEAEYKRGKSEAINTIKSYINKL